MVSSETGNHVVNNNLLVTRYYVILAINADGVYEMGGEEVKGNLSYQSLGRLHVHTQFV